MSADFSIGISLGTRFLINFRSVAPEVILLAGACFVLLFDLFIKDKNKVCAYVLSCFVLGLSFIYLIFDAPSAHAVTFGGQYFCDGFSQVIKLVAIASLFIIFVYSRRYWCSDEGVKSTKGVKSEFYVLTIFSLLGGFIMISAGSMLVLYLGLELLSLPLYAIIAMEVRYKNSSEASLKYFVMGALASGILLYGMSLIFGVAHTLDLRQIMIALYKIDSLKAFDKTVIMCGFGFVIVSIAFKFGLVPFHMWVPDVYQGAPTPVTAIIGSIAKLSAFGFLIRLFIYSFTGLKPHWMMLFLILGLLSIIIGNLGAIFQTNLKRLFAYSTISHVGFVFLALSCASNDGYTSAVFYIISYSIMSVGGFGVILLLQYKTGRGADISDYSGLHESHPWVALMMMLFLLSFAGIPPLLGFDAKLFVMDAMLKTNNSLYYVSALISLFMSVIAAYYYIKVIKQMYFVRDQDKNLKLSLVGFDGLVLSINGLFVFIVGIMPALWVEISKYAAMNIIKF